ITLVGFFNDPENKLDVDLIADSFDYSGSHYEQARLRCQNSEESFITDLGINKFNKSSMVSLGLHAKANADRVEASINWDNNKKTGSFRGQLNAHAIFEKQPGMPMDIGVLIHPSDVTVNDTTWNIRPAQIHIKGKEYAVNNLTIENGDRRLRLHGAVSENPNDSLIAELKEINVDYVLRAVNFDAVSFSGYATGKAYASDLLHDMKADTQLFVRDLHFQGGQMGNMNLYGRWENEKSAIYLNGHITEFGGSDTPVDSTQVWNSWHGFGNYIGRTHAEGRISPKYDTIDLMINAENTNVAFLQGFVGNVFDNISGRTTGWCHIGNTLKDVDITAQMKADMKAKVRSLNTTYNIKTDSIQFITNRMRFINVDIID
ncbi:MAG: hypothetical protein HUJ98_14910, partial [Bacteroidaceae bacterium]|nr:hypothetical protein [Bacteroidaceae bacterium]